MTNHPTNNWNFYDDAEDAFSINAVALVNGKPKTLGLKELLQVFIDHRIQVVTRRSNFRKAKASARLNLVEGLLKAIIDIDKVVKIIRGSDDANEAKESLIKSFKLSEEQATYILDMPLRRLTKMSKIEFTPYRQTFCCTCQITGIYEIYFGHYRQSKRSDHLPSISIGQDRSGE